MITVNNFVAEFMLKKTEDAKKAYVKSHIKVSYLSYLHKMTMCDTIIKASDYKTVDLGDGVEKTYFTPNSANRYFFFIMQIIQNYTDIICSEEDATVSDKTNLVKDLMKAFDRLEEHGITSILIELLGNEYISLKAVLDMSVNDTYCSETSLPTYLATKMDSLNLVVTQLQNALAESN